MQVFRTSEPITSRLDAESESRISTNFTFSGATDTESRIVP